MGERWYWKNSRKAARLSFGCEKAGAMQLSAKIDQKNCQHILLEFSKYYSCLVHDFVKNGC